MTTIKKKLILGAATLAVAFGAAPQVMAADALAICQSGVPYVYPNGGRDIPFNPDAGPLRVDTDGTVLLDNAAGVAVLETAFAAWENLPQSSMSAKNAGTLPVDIDITNFGPVLVPAGPDGLSPIVFDANGEIFALLFGLSLMAEILSNDQPLLVRYDGELYFPIIKSYPETTFGGDFATATDYREPYILEKLQT